jgi:predicted metal-dependent hydrolase
MSSEQRHVRFGRSAIVYRIQRSDRRRMVTITVEPTDGVVVKAPSDALARRLDGVVIKKAPWILQRLIEFREFGLPLCPGNSSPARATAISAATID